MPERTQGPKESAMCCWYRPGPLEHQDLRNQEFLCEQWNGDSEVCGDFEMCGDGRSRGGRGVGPNELPTVTGLLSTVGMCSEVSQRRKEFLKARRQKVKARKNRKSVLEEEVEAEAAVLGAPVLEPAFGEQVQQPLKVFPCCPGTA